MSLADLLPLLDDELQGMEFGQVTLVLQVRDGRLHRAEVSRSRSIMLNETDAMGVGKAPNSRPVKANGERRPVNE